MVYQIKVSYSFNQITFLLNQDEFYKANHESLVDLSERHCVVKAETHEALTKKLWVYVQKSVRPQPEAVKLALS